MLYITGQEWSAYDLPGEGLYITSRLFSRHPLLLPVFIPHHFQFFTASNFRTVNR